MLPLLFVDIADNLKLLHFFSRDISVVTLRNAAYFGFGILYRYCYETGIFLVKIHYGKIVVALAIFKAAERIFVGAQHVALINLLAVLVEEASELADGGGGRFYVPQ